MKLEKNTRKSVKAPSRRKTTLKVAPITAPELNPSRIPPAPEPVAEKKSSAPITTIEAKIDVGFGNTVFVRGQGDGLSWDKGVPLKCIDGQTWRWSGPVSEKLTFKLLLNDQVWARGDDLEAKAGQKLEVTPTF